MNLSHDSVESKDGACKALKHTEVFTIEKIVLKGVENRFLSKLNQLVPRDKDDDLHSRNVKLKMGEICRKELGTLEWDIWEHRNENVDTESLESIQCRGNH